MGVLNVTPDSFSDGGRYFSLQNAVERAEQLIADGADILDVGGQSTRPGFTQISAQQELSRIMPVLSKLNNFCDVPISVDTFYPKVAEQAAKFGAKILNIILGFNNSRMFQIAKYYNMFCVINYCGLANDAKSFFKVQIKLAKQYKILEPNLWLDPGVGFNKTFLEDFEIIKSPQKFCPTGYPVLVGISRKRVTRVLLALLDIFNNFQKSKVESLVNNYQGYLNQIFKENPEQILTQLNKDEFLHKIKEIYEFCIKNFSEEKVSKADPRDVITGVLSAIASKNGKNIVRVHNVSFTKKILKLAKVLVKEPVE